MRLSSRCSGTLSTEADPQKHPHIGHLFKIGVLIARSEDRSLPKATRREAAAEVLRYRDEGVAAQKHGRASLSKKTRAHEEPAVFTGQGIIFAVIDDREKLRDGKATTIDVIADAIDAALDAGHEDSEEIARYLTTSAFQHIPDKRIRFNSVLKAGDVVGAQIIRKLYNSYNELAKLADEEQDSKKKAELRSEALGFAEAIQVVISPFSCEDPEDPRLVDWDEVDRLTAAFEKEQRLVRKDRDGKPQ